MLLLLLRLLGFVLDQYVLILKIKLLDYKRLWLVCERIMPNKKKKPISIASRKAKARIAQNWVASKISELLGVPWGKDEAVAAREMGQTGVDVRLVGEALVNFPWSLEVKFQEKWDLPAAIRQAKDNQMKDTEWLVILKKNRQDYVAVLDAVVFFELLSKIPNKVKGIDRKEHE